MLRWAWNMLLSVGWYVVLLSGWYCWGRARVKVSRLESELTRLAHTLRHVRNAS